MARPMKMAWFWEAFGTMISALRALSTNVVRANPASPRRPGSPSVTGPVVTGGFGLDLFRHGLRSDLWLNDHENNFATGVLDTPHAETAPRQTFMSIPAST